MKTVLDFPTLSGSPSKRWQTAVRPLGPEARRRVAADGSTATIDLAEVLTFAVEMNRSRAARYGVRLHFYVLDQVIALDDQFEVLQKLDMLLRRTICRAHWGSALVGQVGIRNGMAEVHIRFARPSGTTDCAHGLDWVDEVWTWPCGEITPHDQPLCTAA